MLEQCFRARYSNCLEKCSVARGRKRNSFEFLVLSYEFLLGSAVSRRGRLKPPTGPNRVRRQPGLRDKLVVCPVQRPGRHAYCEKAALQTEYQRRTQYDVRSTRIPGGVMVTHEVLVLIFQVRVLAG